VQEQKLLTYNKQINELRLFQVTNMCILLYVINSHYVACTHFVASSVIIISLVHVFCFLYFAACQSYLRCNHINVFCFMLSVITVLFIVIKLHHLSHDIAYMYILLLVFCFLCSASYVLLLMFCFLYFASCVLLLIFCFLCFASCILLLVFYFLYSASCILLLVFCFLYSAACRSYSRCSHTDMCILLCVTCSHCVVCSYEIASS